MRDVAEAHVAGLEKLAGAYLGDRDGIEVVDRNELAARLKRRQRRRARRAPRAPSSPPGTSPAPGRCRSASCASTSRPSRSDAEVVAYCRGPYCVYADDAVRELAQARLQGRPPAGRLPRMATRRASRRVRCLSERSNTT